MSDAAMERSRLTGLAPSPKLVEITSPGELDLERVGPRRAWGRDDGDGRRARRMMPVLLASRRAEPQALTAWAGHRIVIEWDRPATVGDTGR
jgi:hypothetical protein